CAPPPARRGSPWSSRPRRSRDRTAPCAGSRAPGAQPADLGVAAAFPELNVAPGHTLPGTLLGKAFHKNGHDGNGRADGHHGANGQHSANGNGHRPKKECKRMVAPSRGMGDVTERLQRRLKELLRPRFRRGVRVNEIPEAPNVVISTPAYAAELLRDAAPKLSRGLSGVRYTPIVSVTAFVARENLTRPVKGVGVLAPRPRGASASASSSRRVRSRGASSTSRATPASPSCSAARRNRTGSTPRTTKSARPSAKS
ncbi:MAG TPA: hypothetical protein VGV38_22435, partial [Pyrinomonadaceae bacterium]|nr:hypothetical protein [Pyrinomonadaceae bacterium]